MKKSLLFVQTFQLRGTIKVLSLTEDINGEWEHCSHARVSSQSSERVALILSPVSFRERSLPLLMSD
jgi:hypothetical protein